MKRIKLIFACMSAFVVVIGHSDPVKVKVVQCWDDSLSTDIPLVALLQKHHAKATFNIIPRETPRHAFVVKKKGSGERVLFSFL